MSPARNTVPWIVEVRKKPDITDAEGDEFRHSLLHAGFAVQAVRVHPVYFIHTDHDSASLIRAIALRLLVDPVIEVPALFRKSLPILRDADWDWDILRTYHAGVTDNTGETALAAVHAMGLRQVRTITTGRRFLIRGRLSQREAETAAVKVLANPVIETVTVRSCR